MQRGALSSRLLPLALPVLLAPIGCPSGARSAGGGTCGSLDAASCRGAQALALAASTYSDEAHDLVLATPGVSPLDGLARAGDGWRTLSPGCVRSAAIAPRLEPGAVDYAFVGVAVDETLVSADADVGPLLARRTPAPHVVRLAALAIVRDVAPPLFRPGASLVETASGACTCGEATHFAGATKYGAMLAYEFASPPLDGRAHVSALDFVRAALADATVAVHESRAGRMTIDGLAAPLSFHVIEPVPVAYAASPLEDLCAFPAPEVTPSPLDFGMAPYGTEARRTARVVNRAPIELHAILGASTFTVPPNGAIDLPLQWTPDGDAPGCETQTRDEAIPFLRAGGVTPRTARILETIRTGRATVERAERVAPSPPKLDLASTVRDWTCPRDFVRSGCRAENAAGEVVVEPKGEDACHFACSGGRDGPCRFDAVMTCALHCAP